MPVPYSRTDTSGTLWYCLGTGSRPLYHTLCSVPRTNFLLTNHDCRFTRMPGRNRNRRNDLRNHPSVRLGSQHGSMQWLLRLRALWIRSDRPDRFLRQVLQRVRLSRLFFLVSGALHDADLLKQHWHDSLVSAFRQQPESRYEHDDFALSHSGTDSVLPVCRTHQHGY